MNFLIMPLTCLAQRDGWAWCRVADMVCIVPGWLPPVPSGVRDGQRPQGGGRELAGRVQGRLRHRHDRAAAHAPHPPRARPQLLSTYTTPQHTTHNLGASSVEQDHSLHSKKGLRRTKLWSLPWSHKSGMLCRKSCCLRLELSSVLYADDADAKISPYLPRPIS